MVAFRGSNNINNWVHNLGMVQTPYKALFSNIRVHLGFYNSYKGVEA